MVCSPSPYITSQVITNIEKIIEYRKSLHLLNPVKFLSSANTRPSQIGGRRKVPSETMETSAQDEVPPSPDSNLSPSQTQPPTLPPQPAPNSTPPVKPPRPKMPIYANIDENERQTHGAASDSGSSGVNPGIFMFYSLRHKRQTGMI